MAALAINDDLVAAATRQRFGQCGIGVEAVALLLQGRHGEIGAQPHGTGIRRQFSRQKIDQGGFARAICTNNAQPVPA